MTRIRMALRKVTVLGGGGGFSGVLDNLTPTAAFSTRRLRAAYTGMCLRVRRDSDDAEQDIGFIGAGFFDTATFTAFIGAGNGFVRTWYDQSGNGHDAAQATSANQPQVVASVLNGHPVLRFDGIGHRLQLATIPSLANGNYTLHCVRKSSTTGVWFAQGNSADAQRFIANFHINTGNNRFNQKSDAGVEISAGAFDTAAANDAFHAVCARRNGTSWLNRVSATSSTASATLGTTTTDDCHIGARNAGGSFVAHFNGDIVEVSIFALALVDGVVTSIIDNQEAFYDL